MNWSRFLITASAGIVLLACSEDVYDSSAYDNGTVVLTVVSPGAPTACTVIVPGIDTVATGSGEPVVMTLPSGQNRFVAYAGVDYVNANGTVISSESTDIAGSVYTGMIDFQVAAAETSDCTLFLEDRTRKVNVIVSNADGYDAVKVMIHGVATSIDAEYNRRFAASALEMQLQDGGAEGEMTAEARIFGFASEAFSMDVILSKNGQNDETLTFDTALANVGNNDTEFALKISLDLSDESRSAVVGPDDGSTGTVLEPYRPTVYEVGDYYPDPDADVSDPDAAAAVEGVVFYVDETGQHGKIISLEEGSMLKWNTTGAADYTDDTADGMVNFQTVMKKDPDFGEYPAFAWCAGLGEGWYIPAIDEVKQMRSAWGATTAEREAFNAKFTAIGAVPFSSSVYVSSKGKEQSAYYYSSTEDSGTRNKIWSLSFSTSDGDPVSGVKKSSDTQENLLYRAIKVF